MSASLEVEGKPMCAVVVEGGLPTASYLGVRTQESCLTLQPGNVV